MNSVLGFTCHSACDGLASMSVEVISRALDKYSRHVERTTRKILHRLYLDETRRSMYCELKEDYDEHLASAKAHGIG